MPRSMKEGETAPPQVQQPKWISLCSISETAGWEIQLDGNARPGSPNLYRHRPRAFTGEELQPWRPGRPNDPGGYNEGN